MKIRPLVLIFLLAGCSSYKVVKLDSKGAIPNSANGGIPLTLGRPQFVVKKVEGSDPVQYQVTVTYVPDPEQRYAVRLASTPLANAEVNLAFNDIGGLSSSTATVKDQLAPTTLALFKLTASAAVAAGTGGFMSLAAPTTLGDCFPDKGGSAQGARMQCMFQVLAADSKTKCYGVADAADGLIARLAPYVDAEKKDKGEPIKSLFARDAAETGCLADVGIELKALVDGDANFNPAALASDLKTALNNVTVPPTADQATGISAAVRNAASAAISGAIERGDLATVKRWYYVASDPKLTAERLQALVSTAAKPDFNDGSFIATALKTVNLAPDAQDAAGKAGLDRVRRIGEAAALADGFAAAVDLQPGVWRGRYIAFLQKRAEEAERQALLTNPSADVRFDSRVRGIREQIAALAGVRAEYDRWMEYLVRLKTLPATPGAAQRLSPASEYESLRTQAAALELGISAAIAARLTTETAKKAAPPPPTSPWMDAACVAASGDEAWRYRVGTEAAPFAIVLKRADGSAIKPSKGGLECAG